MKKISFLLFLCLSVFFSQAQSRFNNVNADGVILSGYDAVAYFTDSKAVKGDAMFQFKYDEAIYYFVSKEHLDLFTNNPDKYKPQFGGWCAYAVALGRVAPIDPNLYSIVDGRLFVQHNQRAVNGWDKDVNGNIISADKYWPEVSGKMGQQILTDEEKQFYNNVDTKGVSMEGYDPVAYFTEKKPVKGDAQFSARFHGATYYFSSEANATMFKNNPEMFAPQYGSFCGYAMAFNARRPVNPKYWNIVDGKLILQHSKGAWELFNKDEAKFKAQADTKWPPIQKVNAGMKVAFDKPV